MTSTSTLCALALISLVGCSHAARLPTVTSILEDVRKAAVAHGYFKEAEGDRSAPDAKLQGLQSPVLRALDGPIKNNRPLIGILTQPCKYNKAQGGAQWPCTQVALP